MYFVRVSFGSAPDLFPEALSLSDHLSSLRPHGWFFAMPLEHLPAAARAATPWRNGGGVTREVAIEPDAKRGFRWRISIAEVTADGPFSTFTGCGRVLTVLRGAGLELRVDGVAHTIARPYEPFDFDGAAATECRLIDGPVLDINLIRADDQAATVEIGRRAQSLGPIVRAVVVALEDHAWVRTSDTRLRLDLLDAVDIRDEPAVSIDGGVFLVVRLGLEDPSLAV
jgi:uncharacterized protein